MSHTHRTLMIKKILALLTLICLPACNSNKKSSKKRIVEPPVIEQEIPPTTITVFVHGIRLAHFLQRMPLFHNSFHCPKGLTLAKDLDTKYLLSNVQELYKTDPYQFNKETVYMFGWSGRPSYKARYEAAQDLYQGLLMLQKRHGNLPITVITQSHGGNVGLNLGRVVKENNDTTLSIERLVICASPVQAATAQYVHSPLFKNVYAFFSAIDLLQVIDPQKLHEKEAHGSYLIPSHFSNRRFPDDPKLIQSRVRLNSWYIGHSGFIYKPFLRQLPALLITLSTPEGRATLPKVKGRKGCNQCNSSDFMIRIKT